jgi:DNA-binding CsgD family transcriptional regulator
MSLELVDAKKKSSVKSVRQKEQKNAYVRWSHLDSQFLIEKRAIYSYKELAEILGRSVCSVANQITTLRKAGAISDDGLYLPEKKVAASGKSQSSSKRAVTSDVVYVGRWEISRDIFVPLEYRPNWIRRMSVGLILGWKFNSQRE